MTEVITLKTPVDFTNRYSGEAMKTLSNCQGQYADFVSKRLAEDFAMPQRLADSKTPMEIIYVWAAFYTKAMEDYAGHARRMTLVGNDAVEDMVREAEIEAEQIVEATGQLVKTASAN